MRGCCADAACAGAGLSAPETTPGSAESARRAEIRVLPLSPPVLLTLEAPFVLVELDEDGDGVVYRESGTIDELLDNHDTVSRYRRVVGQMLEKALGAEASLRLVEARLANILTRLDRAELGHLSPPYTTGGQY